MSKSKEAVRPLIVTTSDCAERGVARRVGRPPKPKARMGRPPKLVNQIERAMQALDANLPALIDKLIELAYTKNDASIIQYLIDRKLGRPAQQVNANVKGAMVVLSADDYASARAKAIVQEQVLLDSATLPDKSAILQADGTPGVATP